jgi:small subunit ribosomal protein S4e
MHRKRNELPKSWPVNRKGTKYVVNSANSKEMPILVILRDILKIARTRREVKKAVNDRNLLVDLREVRDEKKSVSLFDTITIVPSKKNYRLILTSNGRLSLDEIKESEASKKIAKIVNKKILKGKKIQLNLSDGKNFISDLKCSVNDSVLINFKDKKIEKCLPLKEKSNAIIVSGKHTGKKGTIKHIDTEKKIVSLMSDQEEFNVLIKQLMVTE